ncbi:MAG: hypothetical protein AAB736_00920 [Patescibacteria group bacterium]
MKKIVFLIIVAIITAVGIGGYFIFKKPVLIPEPKPMIEKISNNSPFGALPFFSFSEPTLKNSAPPGPEKLDFAPTKDLGLKWGRAHYLTWPTVQPTKEDVDKEIYNWSNIDVFIGSFPKGFNVVENIVGFSTQTTNEKGEPSHGFSFPNKNVEEGFIRFVKKAVERYDGDGKNDMPNLKSPIKYWQVENEPDLSSKDLDGFANLQKITYVAIKSACPDCKVLMGGMAGGTGGLNFFKPVLEKLGGKYFDVFDYHCYGTKDGWKKCGDLAGKIKKAFPNYDFEIWLTETGTFSGSTSVRLNDGAYTNQTEKEQAKAVVKYNIYPLSKNVKKVFWAWGILEGFGENGDTLFNKTGLIYDGQDSDDLGFGVKKLSYYTYKKMVEVLEGSDWDNIETIQEKDGVYVYKFMKGGQPIWVAWNDNDDEKEIVIGGIGLNKVKITEAVPSYSSGKEVANYSTAFSTKTVSVENGKVSLSIKDKPLFVETN